MTGNDPERLSEKAGRAAFVVDDDDLTRQVVAAYVEHLGYRPVEVQPDRTAIADAIADAGTDDVLILDIILGPELDGFEVIRLLGDVAFHGRLIIVSGFGQDYLQTLGSLATALSIRVAGALAKPVTPADLERCLNG